MRILVILSLMTALASCATWDGFKKDVKTGADKVSAAL
jgi:predicted small secreted protein